MCAFVKVFELLIYWLRNLGAHPLSLEHLEAGFEHLIFISTLPHGTALAFRQIFRPVIDLWRSLTHDP